eukprot:SAG22_NODE_270_length_13234_cov_13.248573_2_plen_138_part_00
MEEHLQNCGLRYTIVRPTFFIDQFWLPTTPWAHPGRDVVMPFKPGTVQQMVWSEDLGALVAKAFLQGDQYLGLEIDLAGDALTGPEIAAVFSMVTGRPMAYKRGPNPVLLALGSREGSMQTRYIDDVGNIASVGQCR